MREQSEKFGTEFIDKKAESVDFSADPKKIIADGNEYLAKAVIIATGAETKWLGVPGEERLRGRGVSSCAPCDAPFFKDKRVAVVGGGDAAMEEALILTKYAKEVLILHRREELKASKAMQERVFDMEKEGKIKIEWNSGVIEFIGDQSLERIKIKDSKTGDVREMDVDGVFVAVGHAPSTNIFKGKVDLDEKGFVKQEPKLGFTTATNVKGVFVAGDVHDYKYRQAITAAAFGCMAGLDVLRFLD
jgi:thioredoxin reductase (NADPH)